MTALERLSQRLEALADAGTIAPCVGRKAWTSDDADDHETARQGCRRCVAQDDCHAAALELRVTAGTWAGITYGTTARKAKSA